MPPLDVGSRDQFGQMNRDKPGENRQDGPMPTPDLIGRRFEKAQATYGDHAQVQARVSAHLAALLRAHCGTISGQAMDIGCGTGQLTRLIHQDHQLEAWTLNDLYSPPAALVNALAPAAVHTKVGDAQHLPLGGPYQLICAGSSLHWLTNPEAFCAQLPAYLTAGGVLAMATYGPGNLKEVAELTDHGLNYPAAHQWADWLSSAGLTINVFEEGEDVEHFDTPLHALKSLKATGVTATGGRSIRTPAALRRLDEAWRAHFSLPDGRVTLSWRPVWIIATKPQRQTGNEM